MTIFILERKSATAVFGPKVVEGESREAEEGRRVEVAWLGRVVEDDWQDVTALAGRDVEADEVVPVGWFFWEVSWGAFPLPERLYVWIIQNFRLSRDFSTESVKNRLSRDLPTESVNSDWVGIFAF